MVYTMARVVLDCVMALLLGTTMIPLPVRPIFDRSIYFTARFWSVATDLIPLLGQGFLLLATVIVLLEFRNSRAPKEYWAHRFMKRGFDVSPALVKAQEEYNRLPSSRRKFHKLRQNLMVRKADVDFKVYIVKQEGRRVRYEYRASFFMPEYIREYAHMRVQRKDAHSNLNGYRGRSTSIGGEVSVFYSNVLVAKHVLRFRHNIHYLKKIVRHHPIIDFQEEINIDPKRSIEELADACNDFVKLLPSLREVAIEVQSERRYTIQEVLDNLILEYSELICMICFQSVALREAHITNCCSSIAHRDHIAMWLRTHKECPYCRRKNVILLNPV